MNTICVNDRNEKEVEKYTESIDGFDENILDEISLDRIQRLAKSRQSTTARHRIHPSNIEIFLGTREKKNPNIFTNITTHKPKKTEILNTYLRVCS